MKNFKQCHFYLRMGAAFVALVIMGGPFTSGISGLLAQDSPQWRGLNRDGKVTGFTAPATWPSTLTQKWQVKIGQSDASPVLVGENLYVFFRQGTDEVLLCLDAASGKTLWEAKYPAGRVVTGPPARHPGPRHARGCRRKDLHLGCGHRALLLRCGQGHAPLAKAVR